MVDCPCGYFPSRLPPLIATPGQGAVCSVVDTALLLEQEPDQPTPHGSAVCISLKQSRHTLAHMRAAGSQQAPPRRVQ